jgi:lysophospholipase L1-like esterase
MMKHRILAALGSFSLVALSACGGNTTSGFTPTAGNVTGGIAVPPGTALTSRIVGIGDSLTAGEQSGALLGQSIPNPLYPSQSPFATVQNTQGQGFYALVWSQANNGANPLDPNISPLPLIAAPGIGQILLPTNTGGLTSITTACGGVNQFAYSLSTASQTRINPSKTPLDLGVPGITLHEALNMYQPLTPCNGSGFTPPYNGLSAVIASESQNFYPVLQNFGGNVSEVQAATRLQPTLATVWLGSNDLLHYLGSNGGFPPPTPASFQSDTVTVITTLQKAGAKVVISNLVDVLTAAYFTPVAQLPAYITGGLIAKGVPPSTAQQLGTLFGTETQSYLQTTFQVGNGGYLQLSGFGKVSGAIAASITNPAQYPTALAAAGITTGDYVSDSVAATGAQLNTAYNAAIAAAATSTGATLVDTHAFVASIYNSPGQYYPLPSNPKCCSLIYGGGFFSLDGIHPSNTGYAIIANLFIQAIDTGYGGTIPPLSSSQIAAINATDPYSPH